MIHDTTDTIDNYETVIDCLEAFETLMPDGSRVPIEVENPAAHEKANPPEFLRVKLPRKSTDTVHVIDTARELGLEVGDVWQLEQEHDDDLVAFKLVPRRPRSEDARAVLEDLRETYREKGLDGLRDIMNEAAVVLDEEIESDEGFL